MIANPFRFLKTINLNSLAALIDQTLLLAAEAKKNKGVGVKYSSSE